MIKERLHYILQLRMVMFCKHLSAILHNILLIFFYLYYSVVKELLKCDADLVKDQDNRLNTALYFACRYGHYKVAVVLLEANADPNVKLVYWENDTTALYSVFC